MALRLHTDHILILRPFPQALADPGALTILAETIKKKIYPHMIPVHWNLPAYTLEDGISGLRQISNEDPLFRIIPAGYSGRPHQLMSESEILRDLDLGREVTRKFTGDSAQNRFSLLYFIDSTRAASGEVYAREDLLLLNRQGTSESTYRLDFPGGSFIPVNIFSGIKEKTRKNPLLSLQFKLNTRAIVLEFPTRLSILAAEEKIAEFLSIYKNKYFVNIEDIKNTHRLNEEVEQNRMTETHFWSPAWREFTMMDSDRTKPPEPPKQALIADMLGDVAMEDDNFTVHFRMGRWNGISRNGTPLLPLKKAGAFIKLNGKKLPLLPPAAYSFDSPDSRGLREILRFKTEEGEQGKIVTDYFFTDNYPCIVISTTASYPAFRDNDRIDAHGIMEIHIFEGKENELPVKVEYLRSFDSQKAQTLLNRPGIYHITGNKFKFTSNNTVLTLNLPEEGPTFFTLPIKLRKKGKKLFLSINPWGSYGPVSGSELSGLSEHFTLLIEAGLKNEVTGKIPPTDRYPVTPPFRIGRKGSPR
ncbi:MAG: hypothetical protein JEY99_08865 [Spirochaetales bacterium]|nr:hypothetical protein [Spirochaetales bacterium]